MAAMMVIIVMLTLIVNAVIWSCINQPSIDDHMEPFHKATIKDRQKKNTRTVVIINSDSRRMFQSSIDDYWSINFFMVTELRPIT
jgi:hypothetical protein